MSAAWSRIPEEEADPVCESAQVDTEGAAEDSVTEGVKIASVLVDPLDFALSLITILDPSRKALVRNDSGSMAPSSETSDTRSNFERMEFQSNP